MRKNKKKILFPRILRPALSVCFKSIFVDGLQIVVCLHHFFLQLFFKLFEFLFDRFVRIDGSASG